MKGNPLIRNRLEPKPKTDWIVVQSRVIPRARHVYPKYSIYTYCGKSFMDYEPAPRYSSLPFCKTCENAMWRVVEEEGEPGSRGVK